MAGAAATEPRRPGPLFGYRDRDRLDAAAVTAVLSDEAGHGHSQRGGHIALIEAKGRLECQKATGYCRRTLAETTMGRYKWIIGRNFEQEPLQVNRPNPPLASRF